MGKITATLLKKETKLKLLQIFILLLISFTAFVLWVCEIGVYGWAGISWIEYHLVSPYATGFLAALFAAFFAKVRLLHKFFIFILSYGLFIFAFYLLNEVFLDWSYFFMPLFDPIANLIFIVIPVLIFLYFYLLRFIFKINCSHIVNFISFAIILGFIPLSMLINLVFLNQWGTLTIWGCSAGNDMAHVIKTGAFLVPFIFGIGLPFIFQKPGYRYSRIIKRKNTAD